jgi:BolA protein
LAGDLFRLLSKSRSVSAFVLPAATVLAETSRAPIARCRIALYDRPKMSNGDDMSITEELDRRLRRAFAPRELVIRDDSEQHRGHAGFREGGESHFFIRIRSAVFEDKSRLNRHRAVHDALGDLTQRIHALSFDLDV